MTDHLLQASMMTLDALEHQGVTRLGEQLQADYQALLCQSALSWLGEPHCEANLETFEELTADMQQLLQVGEALLDLERWLTSGFVAGINPSDQPLPPDRPFRQGEVMEPRATQVQPSGESAGRSPDRQASTPKADTIPTLAEKTSSTSPDLGLPIYSSPPIPLPQSQISPLQVDRTTASDSEPTRFSILTAFSGIGERFTAAQSGSELSDPNRSDLWNLEEAELENQIRAEQPELAQPDAWKAVVPHSTLPAPAQVPLIETEMQISQSFKGLRDLAQILEASVWTAIAPPSAPANDLQQPTSADQPISPRQEPGNPEARLLNRGQRVGGDKQIAQLALLPEITAHTPHNLNAASVSPPSAAATDSMSSFQPAQNQTAQDSKPRSELERSEPERSEPEIRPLRLSEQDLDMILEAIAQEVQQEYRQFYGS